MRQVRLSLLLAAGLTLLSATTSQSQFVKTIGGDSLEIGNCLIRAHDDGFVVAGQTQSFGAGYYDVLLSKLDAYGHLLWTRTLGGTDLDVSRCVIETSDKGYLATGSTYSYSTGYDDLLLAKFDSSGSHLWTRAIGGSDREIGTSVIEANDGGFVMMGYTWSFGVGDYDWILAKLDTAGNLLWTRTLGWSSQREYGHSLVETSDGGFVGTGETFSWDYHGDMLVAKFDSTGNPLWTRLLDGGMRDGGKKVIQASDGGIVVAGHTKSFGAGDFDLFLVKFDATGNHLWSRTLGGSEEEMGHSVTQVSDGGFVVIGHTYSFGAGDINLLLAKFDSTGNHLWTRTLEETFQPENYSVVEASDGSLVVTSNTRVSGTGDTDLLFAKFDAGGNTCRGEFVAPTITLPSPTITSPSPVLTTPSPTIASPTPTLMSPSPTATLVCTFSPNNLCVTDVGNDQGKQVRVKWDRCYYDAGGSPLTIAEYSVWRRIGDDKDVTQASVGSFYAGRIYPPGDWDFIITVPARGEEEYNVVCPTLGDSTQAEGMYWSVFFVSAMTSDPLVYFDSEPDSGYSLDNIPPLPIVDLEIDPDSWFTLEWTVPGEYPGEEPISDYDIRYNTVPHDGTPDWWENSVPCNGVESFGFVVGETDKLDVDMECSCYPDIYLAVKALDERSNASEISNIVHFVCGDANGDELVDLGDAVKLLNYLFKGQPPPQPLATGDTTCDEIVDLGDVVYVLNYLFKGGPKPCSE